jgi:hypothetical protein
VMLLRPDQPPVIGEIQATLAEYVAMSSRGLVADSRVRLLESGLRDAATGQEVSGPLQPGSTLVLNVTLKADAALPRCGLHFQVTRSDGMVVFSGMSTLDGHAEFHLGVGVVLKARVAFQVNVLRGTYSIGLSLIDTIREWPTAAIHGIGSFVVSETTRIAGCAELNPEYETKVEFDDAAPQP